MRLSAFKSGTSMLLLLLFKNKTSHQNKWHFFSKIGWTKEERKWRVKRMNRCKTVRYQWDRKYYWRNRIDIIHHATSKNNCAIESSRHTDQSNESVKWQAYNQIEFECTETEIASNWNETHGSLWIRYYKRKSVCVFDF